MASEILPTPHNSLQPQILKNDPVIDAHRMAIELVHTDEGTLILLALPQRCACGAVRALFWNQDGRTHCVSCPATSAFMRRQS